MRTGPPSRRATREDPRLRDLVTTRFRDDLIAEDWLIHRSRRASPARKETATGADLDHPRRTGAGSDLGGAARPPARRAARAPGAPSPRRVSLTRAIPASTARSVRSSSQSISSSAKVRESYFGPISAIVPTTTALADRPPPSDQRPSGPPGAHGRRFGFGAATSGIQWLTVQETGVPRWA